MYVRDLLIGVVAILMIASTVIPVVSDAGGNIAESSTTAPYEEFYEPDDETLRKAYEDKYLLTFNYTYSMDYDVVPEDMVVLLNGTCISYQYYTITIDRPDDQEITLVDQDVNKTDRIDETHSIRRSSHTRQNIYDEMRRILRRQEDEWNDPGAGDMVNPTKVIFGEVGEEVLVNPDPLKGDYEITIQILGEDMEMDHGEEETKLALLSEHSVSEPRNLECGYEDGEVELRWDEPEEKEGGIRKYNIYRATTIHNYEHIGNASADQTEYVDELEGKVRRQEVRRGDILYYRVVTISEDDYYYVMNRPDKRNLNYHSRRESTSTEEQIHISPEKAEESDMAYKWVMDYSSLSEEDLEDRVGMDSVEVKKMEGGDVFFYDINKLEEDNGKILYEYEGGFFSKGDVDMALEDSEVSTELNISIDNSWCDFSGEIWAEEISEPGNEYLKILNQSIHSEGRVRATLNNTFDFPFKGNETHWQVSKDLDIRWDIDLTLDYTSNNSWVLSRENETPFTPIDPLSQFNYSGSIDSEGSLFQQSNHLDDEKKTEDEISKEISGSSSVFGDLSARGRSETFSPLVGAGNIGYHLALSETLDKSMGSLGGRVHVTPTHIAFSTNCQRDGFSTEKLYRYQYMDPMALPGMGSFLGTALKRANLTNSQHLEVIVEQQIRAEMEDMDFDSPEEMRHYIKSRREELLRRIILRTPWGIQQYNGIYRWDHYMYGGLVIEPFGYFASEPLSEDEIESYREDREQFFDDQMTAQEFDRETILISMVLLAIIIFAALIYIRKEAKEQD